MYRLARLWLDMFESGLYHLMAKTVFPKLAFDVAMSIGSLNLRCRAEMSPASKGVSLTDLAFHFDNPNVYCLRFSMPCE